MSTLEEGVRILFHCLDENAEIVKFDKIQAHDDFSIVIRTKFSNEESWSKTCDNWIERLTVQTNSKWVVKSTFPKAKRMEYRKLFVCKENSNASHNHNKSCPAKVDIKIKKTTDFTLKKDKFLKEGYNAEIKVMFTHSHER